MAVATAGSWAEDWPHWRGPARNGVSAEKGLPLRWTAAENIAWKRPLPDRSGATPIVSGRRIFLNVAEGDALALWALDRATGATVWTRPLGGGNTMMRKQNMSSPSPVTDGKTVYVMTGTGILKAFDFDGRELWARDIQKDYGRFGLNWGYASSPLLVGDALYVQVLHGMTTDDPSYLLRIDAATGKTRWRVERPTDAVRESPDSYTTPALVERGAQREIVVTGGDYVTGHDPATGRELWRAGGLNPDRDSNYRIVASPVVGGRPRARAHAREADARHPRRRPRRRLDHAIACGRSTTAPTCRRRSPTGPTSTSSPTGGSPGASTCARAASCTGPSG